MIDFYYSGTPNGLKVRLFFEETQLAHRVIPVSLSKGEQFRAEFQAISPNSKIPAIVDRDPKGGGEPVSLFESGAILLYLAEKTGKFLPADTAKKFEVIQWLMIQLTGVGPMFGQWTHFKMFAPAGNDYGQARYTSELKRLYALLEERLGKSKFLGGDEYTIADIATFPWTRNHDAQGVKWDNNPNLARWFNTIAERPAVKAALAKVAAIKSNRETASDDDKDRFFNRGKYARA
jgi:GST-like protein